MDVARFDDFVRSLPGCGSRRRVLAAALGIMPGLLGLHRLETSGHDAVKACKGKKGDKKKKCLKKAKKHNAQHECLNDGDCPDQVESCQGGSCQAVCPSAECSGCPLCVTHLQSENNRPPLCANQLTQVAPDSCSTDADCTGDEDDVCVRPSTGSCTQSPCGFCASANVCV